MDEKVKKYLSNMGRKGGRKSRRSLSKEASQKMLQVREARRAYRMCYAQCFWSFDPDYIVTDNDIPWIVQQLLKYGNQHTMKYVKRLCL